VCVSAETTTACTTDVSITINVPTEAVSAPDVAGQMLDRYSRATDQKPWNHRNSFLFVVRISYNR